MGIFRYRPLLATQVRRPAFIDKMSASGGVVDTTFTASASFYVEVDTNFTASASFSLVVDSTFTSSASFSAQVDTNFTASASFQKWETEFTASASFQKWETEFTASVSFGILGGQTFTASASFTANVPRDSSFTASASFSLLETGATSLYVPYPASSEPHYEIRLATPAGVYIDILDMYSNLDYTLVTNDIGTLSIELPANYPINRLKKDSRIEVWRSVGLGNLKLEGDTQFLIQSRERVTDDGGGKVLRITAATLNHVLKRRVIAYNASQLTYVDISDSADDIMKLIVRTNLGSTAVDTDRRMSSTYFAVDADNSLGPVVWRTFPHKNVLDSLRELADASFQLGTPLFFDVVASGPPIKHTFRTWATVRGTDRRAGKNGALILGFNYGSIGAYSILEDWSNEISYVYAAGPGEDDVRDVQFAEDATITDGSPYGRSELWVDFQDGDTAGALLSEARAKLTANRTKKVFTGKLLSTPQATYGVHWGWGDYITVEADEEQFNAFVSAVHITVSGPDGKEDIDAALRSD